MSVSQLTLISPCPIPGGYTKKTGFTSSEGFRIERIEDGAVFLVAPDPNGEQRAAEPRKIPITNVACWSDEKVKPARAKGAKGADAERGLLDDELAEDIKVTSVSPGTVHLGRPPTPAAAPAKKGKRG